MFENNEAVALLLALGVLTFLLPQREQLRRIPLAGLLVAAFATLCLGFVFTVVEGFLWYDLFNALEHVCNNFSILLLVIWAWKLPKRNGNGEGGDA